MYGIFTQILRAHVGKYTIHGKKMEKWWFQGVYVCMLLVMILYWGSMFHLRL